MMVRVVGGAEGGAIRGETAQQEALLIIFRYMWRPRRLGTVVWGTSESF